MEEIVIFSRQLATMINSGLPLFQALDILTDQTENPLFKDVLKDVKKDVETGSSFSEALEKFPNTFSQLYTNMIRAGEVSGMLDDIMARLSDYLEKTSRLQRKVKSALVYPAAVSGIAVIITVVLLVKVVPTFADIFSGFDAELPMPTKVLMAVSDALRFNLHFVFVGAVIGFFVLKHWLKTPGGKKAFDGFSLNMPVFGPLLRKVAISKFSRTFSTLMKSGVPILEALEIVGKTSGNVVVEAAVNSTRASIREGNSMSEPLEKSGVFPLMVTKMIAVGEQTGALEAMLEKIADFYDEQVDAAVTGLTSLIEPLLIAFLGIVIGGVVLAMFMPMFEMVNIVQ